MYIYFKFAVIHLQFWFRCTEMFGKSFRTESIWFSNWYIFLILLFSTLYNNIIVLTGLVCRPSTADRRPRWYVGSKVASTGKSVSFSLGCEEKLLYQNGNEKKKPTTYTYTCATVNTLRVLSSWLEKYSFEFSYLSMQCKLKCVSF